MVKHKPYYNKKCLFSKDHSTGLVLVKGNVQNEAFCSPTVVWCGGPYAGVVLVRQIHLTPAIPVRGSLHTLS